jgi:uncharacterized protein with PIN domain
VALNIRNPETERLAEALANLTGETKTEAVTRALRDRLTRLRRERSRRRLADELNEIAAHCARLPVRDARTSDEILDRAGIELVALDLEQAKVARQAFSRFGKGRHAAGLNYGDCFAYALARVLGQPLLYKGDDFAQTDVVPFLPTPTV